MQKKGFLNKKSVENLNKKLINQRKQLLPPLQHTLDFQSVTTIKQLKNLAIFIKKR